MYLKSCKIMLTCGEWPKWQIASQNHSWCLLLGIHAAAASRFKHAAELLCSTGLLYRVIECPCSAGGRHRLQAKMTEF